MAKKTKKTAKKQGRKAVSRSGGVVVTYHRVLFVQSMILALIGGAAVYSILKAAQLRDNVDAQYLQVLGAKVEAPFNPNAAK